jgi:periplasmic protein TonB
MPTVANRCLSEIVRPGLVMLLCAMLGACGNDEGDGKTVANTPTGDQTTLPDTSNVTLAAKETRHEKANDVLDWLKMSPEKADKSADKKAPEPPKPADAKATPAPVVAQQIPAVQPQQPPSIERQAVLQQVSAPASASFSTMSPPREPSREAPQVVAAAAPVVAAPATPSAGLKLISREQPSFPREAIRSGTLAGHVVAKIEVGTDGNVKNVEVVESKPSHVFDHAVVAAAKNWKYAPMGEPATTMAEFDFKADQ